MDMAALGNKWPFINPGRWYELWELFMLVLALFSTWIAPIEFGFFELLPEKIVFFEFAQLFFLVDIVLKFLVAKSDTRTHTILRYIHSCWIDIMACIPWVYMYYAFGRNNVLRWLVLSRLIRLHKVFELYSRMKDSGVRYFSSKAMKKLVVMLIIAHVGGCFFFYSAIIMPPYEDENTWIGSLTMGEHSYLNFRDMQLWKLYTTSFYFAFITVATVGYGDIHPVNEREMIISMILILCNFFLMEHLSDDTPTPMKNLSSTEHNRDEKGDSNSAVRNQENKGSYRPIFETVSPFTNPSSQLIIETIKAYDEYMTDKKKKRPPRTRSRKRVRVAYSDDRSEIEDMIHERTGTVAYSDDKSNIEANLGKTTFVCNSPDILLSPRQAGLTPLDRLLASIESPEPTAGNNTIFVVGALFSANNKHVGTLQGGIIETWRSMVSRADINVLDEFGNTPILEAIKGKQGNLVSFLREKGAKTIIGDASSFSCSYVEKNDVTYVRWFSDFGMNPLSQVKDKRNAKAVAVKQSTFPMAKKLVKRSTFPMAKKLVNAGAVEKEDSRQGTTPYGDGTVSRIAYKKRMSSPQSKIFSDLYAKGDKKALSFSYDLGYGLNYLINIDFWKKIYCHDSASRGQCGWLDDEHIDIYGHILLNSTIQGKCTIMPVHFLLADEWMEKWIDLGKGLYPPYKSWAVVDSVLLPINQGNSHWLLARLVLDTWTVTVYDSLYMEDRETWMNEKLKTFDINKFLQSIAYWKLSGRPCTTVKLQVQFAKKIPQQENNIDCGVFVCMWLQALYSGKMVEISGKSNTHCKEFRKQLANAIWKRRSHGDAS